MACNDYDAALYVGRYKANQDVLVDGESSEIMLDINSRSHVRISREYAGIARDLDLLKHGEAIFDTDYPAYMDSEVVGLGVMGKYESTPSTVDSGDSTLFLTDEYGRIRTSIAEWTGSKWQDLDLVEEGDTAAGTVGISMFGRNNEDLSESVADNEVIPLATDRFGRLLVNTEDAPSNQNFHTFGHVDIATLKGTQYVIAKKSLSTGPSATTLLESIGAACSDMAKIELFVDESDEETVNTVYTNTTADDTLIGTWFISGAAANGNVDVTFSQPIETGANDTPSGAYVLVGTPMKHDDVCLYGYMNGQNA